MRREAAIRCAARCTRRCRIVRALLAVCEGSDWFWWLGDDNSAEAGGAVRGAVPCASARAVRCARRSRTRRVDGAVSVAATHGAIATRCARLRDLVGCYEPLDPQHASHFETVRQQLVEGVHPDLIRLLSGKRRRELQPERDIATGFAGNFDCAERHRSRGRLERRHIPRERPGAVSPASCARSSITTVSPCATCTGGESTRVRVARQPHCSCDALLPLRQSLAPRHHARATDSVAQRAQ